MVAIASTTVLIRVLVAARAESFDERTEIRKAGLARDRQEPALDQILFVGRKHEAGAPLERAAQEIIIERCHDRLPSSRRRIFPGI